MLSHRQAAALHGFRPANRARIDVTVRAARRDGLPGIDVHLTRTLEPGDVTTVDGIPVTTTSRTLVDLASIVPKDHLAKALRETDRLRLLDVNGIERVLAHTNGRRGPGHRTMREALKEYAAIAESRTASTLEDDFLRLVHWAALPLPQCNVLVHGFKVDAFWPAQRLIVELDGLAYHLNRHAFQQDRERDRKLRLAGYTVLRYTYADVVHGETAVLAELRQALAP